MECGGKQKSPQQRKTKNDPKKKVVRKNCRVFKERNR